MSLYCTCLKKATYSSSIFRDQVPKSLVIFGKKKGLSSTMDIYIVWETWSFHDCKKDHYPG